MNLKHRFALALSFALSLAGSLKAAELVHNPVLSAAAGRDLEITANLVGADQDPRVRLYYRPRGKEIFRSVEMGGTLAQLKGVIPGSNIDIVGLDYYIEASVIKNGQKTIVGTSPASNPTLNPHQVVVRKDETGPEVTALSPADGDTIDTSRPVITAAFGDADSGVDPQTVLIKIDGEIVADKGSIQAFDTMATYVVSKDLKDGEHEIVVAVKDNSGNAGSAKWKVTVNASSSSKLGGAKKGGWVWDGRASAETQYGHSISQSKAGAGLPYRPYGYNKGHLEVNGRGADDTVRLDVTKSDAERTDQQPVDRYVGTWKNRQGVIGLGDFSPSFSELSLYNLYQLRGVTLDLRSGPINEGHTRLVGVWGQTRRAIEDGSTGFAGASTGATFAQYLYGTRWEFGDEYFLMGTNAVAVNDDEASVKRSGSTLPRYNGVLTSDVKIGLPFIYLSLNGEVGTDIYNDPTVLGVSAGTAYQAGLDWNIKPWTTRLQFTFKDLGGGYGLVPGGYTTAANPGLVPDYRGYESSFSQGLFDGQFSLDLGLDHWRDNLQGTKPATTTTDFMSVYSNLAPHEWPYLVLGYTQNLGVNDADGSTGSAFSPPRYKVDNKTSTINVALGYSKSFDATRSGSLNVSYVKQDYVDQSSQAFSQNLSGNNYVLSGFAALGLSSFNASVGIGDSTQPGSTTTGSGITLTFTPKTSNNFNAAVRWNQQWQRSILDTYLGWDLSNSSAGSDAYLSVLATSSKTSRNTFRLGSGWAFAERQKLSADLALAMVNTNAVDFAGVSSSDSLTQLYSGLKYELTF